MKQPRIFAHSSIYIVGTVVQQGLAFLLLPFATRLLGVEQYGVFGVASAVALFLSLLFSVGINFAIVRLYYEGEPDAERTGWAALVRVQVLCGIALAAIVFMLGPVWAKPITGVDWSAVLRLAVLYGLTVSVQTTLQSVLRAMRRPFSFVAISLTQGVIGTPLGLFLAARYDAAGFLGGLAIGSVCAATLSLALTYKRPLWRADTVRTGITLSLPFMVHALSSWALNLADRLLIRKYEGLAAVGRYQVAYGLAWAVWVAMNGVNSAWAPHYLGELTREQRRRMPSLVLIPVVAVVTAVAGLVVLMTPALLRVAAPPQFGGTELVVALVLGAAIVRSTTLVSGAILLDAKSSSSLAVASLLSAVLNVALNVALIPEIGLNGAAVSSTIAFELQSLIVLRSAQRLVGVPLGIPSLAAASVCGIGVLAAASQLPVSALGWTIRGVLAVAVCALGWTALRWLQRRYWEGVGETPPARGEHEAAPIAAQPPAETGQA